MTPHIEIVKASLPKLRKGVLSIVEAQFELACRRALPSFLPQASRDPLFQNLQNGRGRPLGRLTDQQMNVLGHDDVSDEREIKTFSHLPQDSDKGVSRARGTEQWPAPVTTAGDEVKVFVPVVALEAFGHTSTEPKPHPCKRRKDGAPDLSDAKTEVVSSCLIACQGKIASATRLQGFR